MLLEKNVEAGQESALSSPIYNYSPQHTIIQNNVKPPTEGITVNTAGNTKSVRDKAITFTVVSSNTETKHIGY